MNRRDFLLSPLLPLFQEIKPNPHRPPSAPQEPLHYILHLDRAQQTQPLLSVEWKGEAIHLNVPKIWRIFRYLEEKIK